MTLRKISVFILLFFVLCINASAQSYVYKHYTRENGLPGNIVYCAGQDADGFMWFGTENGASRFDGKNFVNFTTDDGLTDNEVLEIFCDSKGRVWFVCFTAPLCYYYKGKIYNPTNTLSLRLQFKFDNIESISEDKKGTIFFRGSGIMTYSNKDVFELKFIFKKSPKPVLISNQPIKIANFGFNKAGNFFFYQTRTKLFEMLPDKNFRELKSENFYSLNEATRLRCFDSPFDSTNFCYTNSEIFNTYFVGDSLKLKKRALFNFKLNNVCISKTNGMIWLAAKDGLHLLDSQMNELEHSLVGKNISKVIVDTQNNAWLTSLGEGVYFLNSSKIKMIDIGKKYDNNITCFEFTPNGKLIIGTEDGLVLKHESRDLNKMFEKSTYPGFDSQIKSIKVLSNNKILLVRLKDLIIFEEGKPDSSILGFAAVKDLDVISPYEYLIAAANGCFLKTKDDMTMLLFGKRFTSVAIGDSGTFWASSIDSLYQIVNKKMIPFSKYNMKKEGRIIDMYYSEDNVFWISTYNKGLKVFKDNKFYEFNFSNGLLSNQCRNLYYEAPGKIWVITNEGVNKLTYDIHDISKATIKSITKADGLPSDLIRQMLKRNDTVWIATNNGLVYFKEKQIVSNDKLPVYITKWTANDSIVNFSELNYKQNKVSIEFTAISFSSGDNIKFRYKLTGLDKNWNVTTQRRIDYGSLKPGSYQFLVSAIDKNGNVSKSAAILSFTIEPPVWGIWWVRLLFAAFMFYLFYLLFQFRLRKIKSDEMENTQINKQFAELKLEAVRAQMDPHFIFNCLNAIQHYNIKENYKSAQYFMSEFSRLIRKTLNHSQKDFILLSEEIELLEIYIKLEKLRFEDLIEYSIEVSDELKSKASELEVPSLIFQPYVENAINHGLKFLKNGNGLLTLKFSIENKRLLVVIEDNGIGINESKRMKTKEEGDHRSLGMSLNDSHISVINKIHDMDISYKITDRSDIDNQSTGTRVEISLPLKQGIL